MNRYVGIDGCRAGWFCVELAADGCWSASIVSPHALAHLGGSATAVLIDIPIGLPDAAVPVRACDRQARRLLGRQRSSSVFPVPARETLSAQTYQEALSMNRHCLGRGLSKQSWLITPKIRQIDELLQTDMALRGILHESHPELCLWALNAGQAMQHNKKTVAGRDERMRLLRRFFPAADALLAQTSACYRRQQAALDDIVDAMVLAVSARLGAGHYRAVPADAPRDSTGLPMQIVFAVPERCVA